MGDSFSSLTCCPAQFTLFVRVRLTLGRLTMHYDYYTEPTVLNYHLVQAKTRMLCERLTMLLHPLIYLHKGVD